MTSPKPTTSPVKKPRDVRVDFFRGAALIIIFVAHVPGNVLGDWIPARFGLSDAAHMFVFISGYAAAIAFGGTFLRFGFLAGAGRIAIRCAQLFGAHIGLFIAVATLCAVFADQLGGLEYAAHLNIGGFFAEPGHALTGLFTLSYVPTFFDILPLYMVVLALVPVATLLARLHPYLPMTVSAVVWLAVQVQGYALPAGYAENALWGFNPFAWQLIFFTGYSLSMGWIARPSFSRPLVTLAAIYVAVSAAAMIPLIYESAELLAMLRDWVLAHASKPDLDIRQYLHFLALALVVLALLEGRTQVLAGAWAKPFVKIGQQALVVFVSGMTLSHLGGMVMQTYGTDLPVQLLVNGVGFGALFAIAYVSAWVKNPPWKAKSAPRAGIAALPAAAPAGLSVSSDSSGLPETGALAAPRG